MTQRYVRSYTLRTSLNNNVYLSNAFKIKDVSHFRKKYVHVICFLLLLYQQRRIRSYTIKPLVSQFTLATPLNSIKHTMHKYYLQ